MDTTLNNLSLCSGGGGLDLGLELVLPSLRAVCWVEWEAFAIDYLASRIEAGCLHPAPIHSDLRSFDGRPWRGTVDCLTAGYPCQPFSVAGRRGGADDPRHLWPHVHRVIGEVEPSIVFAENVSGHLSLGCEQVIAGLHDMGYRVAAGLFTASEVGATHRRERLFILAHRESERVRRLPQPTERRYAPLTDRSGADLVHTGSEGLQGQGMPVRRRTDLRESRSAGCAPADSDLRLRVRGVNDHVGNGVAERAMPALPEDSVGECDLSLFPPGPDGEWGGIPTYLWPATEPGFCELVDGLAPDRPRWLRLLGNGVVPVQAAYAFVSLWAALDSTSSSAT